MNNIILLKNIDFFYNKKCIFKQLNLTIENHTKISIMGINGSGKTTLLKLLNGLLFPSNGNYVFLGKEINKKNLHHKPFHLWFRKNCVLLFQNVDYMFFHPIVYDDLSFLLRILLFEEQQIKEKIQYWAEVFQIEKYLYQNPLYLSGGERKKVALAMLFLLEPEVILMDEPFNHLDPLYIGFMIPILQNYKKTIIFTTHNFELSSEITSNLIVLHPQHGIVFNGNINDFLKDKSLIQKSELYHIHTHKHKKFIHKHMHLHNWKF